MQVSNRLKKPSILMMLPNLLGGLLLGDGGFMLCWFNKSK